jgi:hypothetical protein
MYLMVTREYPQSLPTVFVADHTLHLPTEFVAVEPRRMDFDGNNYVGLTWTYDTRRGSAQTLTNGVPGTLTPDQSVGMARLNVDMWTALDCYRAYFAEIPYPRPGFENTEIIDDIFLGGETQPFRGAAEIVFGGFLPATFFRQRFGAGGDYVLGVTYWFAMRDASGQLTDIDHNGKFDTGWTEIYFNDLYYWGDAAAPGFDPRILDLGTVGLPETGHAFGLGHFGRIFEIPGVFTIAAFNIMSQIYTGPFRYIGNVPTGAFCSMYGSWQ